MTKLHFVLGAGLLLLFVFVIENVKPAVKQQTDQYGRALNVNI